MGQISFADAQYAGKRKKTRREVFLEEMQLVVPIRVNRSPEYFAEIVLSLGGPERSRRTAISRATNWAASDHLTQGETHVTGN